MSQQPNEPRLPELISPPPANGVSDGGDGRPGTSPVLLDPFVSQAQTKPRSGRWRLSRREVVVGLVGLTGGLLIGGGSVDLYTELRRGLSNPQLPKEAHNLDFTAGTVSWFLAGDTPQDYDYGIDPAVTYNGKTSAYLKARVAQPAGFGTLMQAFEGSEYRGKRVRMSGYAKAQGVEHWAGLWMRIDGEGGQVLSFDNMNGRPIQGTRDWRQYAIVLDVPPESVGIYFGILLERKGQIWLSQVQFQIVDANVPTTGT
jgi:hypothetical protein